jgi:type IV pilus assembly protein PilV
MGAHKGERMGTSRSFIRGSTMSATGSRRNQVGVMLLEVLIAILIFSIGILAVVGMQVAAINNVNDSKYRSEAAFLTNRLLSQMWTDAGNIAAYAYNGTGGVPAKLATWVNDPTVGVYKLLPNAANVPPIVTITGASAAGAQVTIQVRWQMPEEAGQTPPPPPHTYTVLATVYTS